MIPSLVFTSVFTFDDFALCSRDFHRAPKGPVLPERRSPFVLALYQSQIFTYDMPYRFTPFLTCFESAVVGSIVCPALHIFGP